METVKLENLLKIEFPETTSLPWKYAEELSFKEGDKVIVLIDGEDEEGPYEEEVWGIVDEVLSHNSYNICLDKDKFVVAEHDSIKGKIVKAPMRISTKIPSLRNEIAGLSNRISILEITKQDATKEIAKRAKLQAMLDKYLAPKVYIRWVEGYSPITDE